MLSNEYFRRKLKSFDIKNNLFFQMITAYQREKEIDSKLTEFGFQIPKIMRKLAPKIDISNQSRQTLITDFFCKRGF